LYYIICVILWAVAPVTFSNAHFKPHQG
jgi:hypothetical protein